MKYLAIALLLVTFLASCSLDKSGLPQPSPVTNSVSAATTTTANTQPVALKLDTSKSAINFLLQGQTVKTSVSSNVLTLTYTGNVKLLVNSADYYGSWALHLNYDFTKALLNGFDYTTVNKDGNTTLNWIDDNLNNITQKTVKDTVVYNVKMVNVKVSSTFTFIKTYSSNDIALSEQNTLLQNAKDAVGFSAYYLAPGGSTASFSNTDKVTYVK